jgi:glutaryl-CoA transferase
MIVELEHPLIGMVRSLATPFSLSNSALNYRRPPPTLGEHTDEIRAAVLAQNHP